MAAYLVSNRHRLGGGSLGPGLWFSKHVCIIVALLLIEQTPTLQEKEMRTSQICSIQTMERGILQTLNRPFAEEEKGLLSSGSSKMSFLGGLADSVADGVTDGAIDLTDRDVGAR